MSIIEDKIKKLTPKQQTLLLFFMPALIIGAFMYYRLSAGEQGYFRPGDDRPEERKRNIKKPDYAEEA